jgi:acylphosphatase
LAQVIRRFRITGKVQGVYFRHSTRVEAERLAIKGYARNLADGSVEVVAQGPVAAVERLRQWLHQGPKMARVETVLELEFELERDTPPPPQFEIL